MTATVGAYAVNTVTPYINGVISKVFSYSLGILCDIPARAQGFISKLEEQELEDLSYRIEPSLRRGHEAIGRSADAITITSKRTEVAKLDSATKRYLDIREAPGNEIFIANVTSFNILSGNGRIYYPPINTTIGFSLEVKAPPEVAAKLTESMNYYSRGREGKIRITARHLVNGDGRVVRLIIKNADEVPAVDWVEGSDPLRATRLL
ncbi:MAG TPA: hypothetical protein PLL33_00755 [Paracoccus sp. (in: a-proteobacteria)]|nr:hypothetical protein [Paracoccus sp. (in: a-proteobacteria)]